MGFWKNGNKFGPGKIVSKNKVTYLIYDKEGNSTKINVDQNQFNQILIENGLTKYKNCFKLSFEDIYKIINTFFNDFLLQK